MHPSGESKRDEEETLLRKASARLRPCCLPEDHSRDHSRQHTFFSFKPSREYKPDEEEALLEDASSDVAQPYRQKELESLRK